LPVTGVVLIGVIAANSLRGIAFGWRYGRRGLEAAMAAHCAVDIVRHAIAPASGLS